MTQRRTLVASVAAGLAAPALAPTLAQGQGTGPNATFVRANANTIGIVSGGIDGTYARFAADLAAVLDDGDYLRVLPILGKGSRQNLLDLRWLRNIDAAIVQADVLATARAERLFSGLEHQVHYVAKLYDEEIHVLARRDIASLNDLTDKPVNLDVRGSGTAMTATLLFAGLGVAVQPRHDTQADALEKLMRGEIAALVYVAGKPARLFTSIQADAGLRLLPIPLSPALLETYVPARFTSADYPQVVPAGELVETLAVGAVLAVYNHTIAERRDRLVRFANSLSAKFDAFLRPPRHPKWREVNLAAQVPGWTRFGGARPAVASRG